MNVPHELDKNFCKSFNTDVDSVYSCFTEQGNPYVMLEPNFYNITSEEIFSDIIVQKFLNVFCDGLQQYKIFREERYIQKIKKLSDTIKKYNFPNLGHISKSDSKQKKSSSNTTKEIAQAQKIIDVARSRGIHMSEALEYDLISKS